MIISNPPCVTSCMMYQICYWTFQNVSYHIIHVYTHSFCTFGMNSFWSAYSLHESDSIGVFVFIWPKSTTGIKLLACTQSCIAGTFPAMFLLSMKRHDILTAQMCTEHTQVVIQVQKVIRSSVYMVNISLSDYQKICTSSSVNLINFSIRMGYFLPI